MSMFTVTDANRSYLPVGTQLLEASPSQEIVDEYHASGR